MDITLIVELIGTLGFPIACVIALGFFVWKIYSAKVKKKYEIWVIFVDENER
jgi:hypothetical protein